MERREWWSMGQVMGEDATEIAPAATVCTANCTAQNQVNGRAVVVGFPFPVQTQSDCSRDSHSFRTVSSLR